MMKRLIRDKRGVVEVLVALALAFASFFLPAAQKDRAFNKTAQAAPITAQP